MSANNGVIRIGRKGIVKFAFGEDGAPFEVDVVVAFQHWIATDESLREQDGDEKGRILTENMPRYHEAAVEFAKTCASGSASRDKAPEITTAEALDFIARLREQYDELTDFFQPKKRKKEGSPDSSGVELRFSEEADPLPSSTRTSSPS